jgi:antirestriction protein ArdC
VTADPPLIAAWLVGFLANPKAKGEIMRTDVYDRITSRIVADLERGVRTWHTPWSVEHAAGRPTRPLRANGVPYQGINIIELWCSAVMHGFAAPIWMTFKQAQELGGHVRKGEHGTQVVYVSKITRTETDAATGAESSREIPFMRSYTVFNVDQIDGLPKHYYAVVAQRPDPAQRIAHAESFLAATRAEIRHGGARAYYCPSGDFIQMPPFESFPDAETYYATRGHETVHWTRHPSRLARDFEQKRYGDEGHAMEELVAELGAAFLCADLGLTPDVRDDHAPYIASWITVLKNDKRAIFTAASHAQRAVDFLHGLQPQTAAAEAAE